MENNTPYSGREIRKELAKLIDLRTSKELTTKEVNRIVNECRKEINDKYGRDWRNKLYHE